MSEVKQELDYVRKYAPTLVPLAERLLKVGNGRVFISGAGPQSQAEKDGGEEPFFHIDFYSEHPGFDLRDTWIIVKVMAESVVATVLVGDPEWDRRVEPQREWELEDTFLLSHEGLIAYIDQFPYRLSDFAVGVG